jgi:hypothetical protein
MADGKAGAYSLRADFLTPVLAFAAPARPWNWI